MSGGLLGASQFYRNDANRLWGEAANTEMQRNATNKAVKQQKQASTLGMAGTGAAIGTEIMPGWGTLIGAGVGLIAGELF